MLSVIIGNMAGLSAAGVSVCWLHLVAAPSALRVLLSVSPPVGNVRLLVRVVVGSSLGVLHGCLELSHIMRSAAASLQARQVLLSSSRLRSRELERALISVLLHYGWHSWD